LRVEKTFKLTIEYDGSGFWGWQVQPDVRTVQGELLKTLKNLIEGNFRLIGASRTDRGVHAEGQVASLHVEKTKFSAGELKKALNALLPSDIYIHELIEMDKKFNARFHARSKLYRYRIIPEKKSPIRRNYTWDGVTGFSIDVAKEIFPSIKGTINFEGLSVGDKKENYESTITRADVVELGDEVHFYIEGNRFFYKMVRILVGFTVAIAVGRESPEALKKALSGKRPEIFWIAPPQGLTLVRVDY